MNIIGGEHIVRHIALIDIHMRPLTTLCLVTSGSIGKFHLQSIIIAVFLPRVKAGASEVSVSSITSAVSS